MTAAGLTPDGPNLRGYVARSRSALLLISVAIVGVFLPVLIVPYGFADDYPILSLADGLGPNSAFGSSIIGTIAASGRPLAGVLDDLFFSAAGTIDNLRFIRLFAVLGIVLLAVLLHWALVRSAIRVLPAALIVLLICTLPSFQEFGSWAVLFNVPYAALLAGGASLIATGAVGESRRQVVDRLICAGALLLGALLIYQPGAMFFWVFLAIAMVGTVDEPRRVSGLLKVHAGVAVASLAFAFVISKASVHFVGSAAPNPTRNSLTGDPIGKIRWFFKDALFQALNLGNLSPVRWVAAVVAILAIVGIPLVLRQRGVRRTRCVLYVAIAAVLVPLTYLPNLVVEENQAYYRTQLAISALLALYACFGAAGIWLTLRPWLASRLSSSALRACSAFAVAVSVTVVGASVVLAARNVTLFFVLPQTTELRLIRSQVSALPLGVPRVAFAPTSYLLGMAPYVRYDEFGLPTTADSFTYQPLVLLTLREEGRLTPGLYPVVDILPYPVVTYPTNEPTIDLALLQKLR